MATEILIAIIILTLLVVPLLVTAGRNMSSAYNHQANGDGLPIQDANAPEWARGARHITNSPNSNARRVAEYARNLDPPQSVSTDTCIDVPGDTTQQHDLSRGLSPQDFQPVHRDRRIERDKRREMVQHVLKSTSEWGYYVFDQLMTEDAGVIDYLVVGPPSICSITLRDEPGSITATPDSQVLVDGKPLADDPRRQAREIGDDLMARLPDNEKPINFLICFTQADMYMGEDADPYRGLCTIWGLSPSLDPEENGEAFNGAEIEEYAELIEQIYERPPFVTPHQEGKP